MYCTAVLHACLGSDITIFRLERTFFIISNITDYKLGGSEEKCVWRLYSEFVCSVCETKCCKACCTHHKIQSRIAKVSFFLSNSYLTHNHLKCECNAHFFQQWFLKKHFPTCNSETPMSYNSIFATWWFFGI